MERTRGYAAGTPSADWPFGESYRSHHDLAQHLHQVGRHHAKRALHLYTSQDEFEQLDAAFSVGSAVELLAKSLLVFVNPALLLPKDADARTILKYSGTKVLGVEPLDAMLIKSLDATKAMDLLRQIKLSPKFWAQDERRPFNVRNAAAHMGVVHQDALRSAVRPMIRFAEHVRTHYGANAEGWWGPETASVAANIAASEENAWIQVVEAKIAAATVRFKALQAGLPKTTAKAILTSLEGHHRTSIEHVELVKCPACGFRGWATGTVDQAIDTEYESDGELTVWSSLHIQIFDCNVCGLELTDEFEVPIAGMVPDVVFLDEDYNPEPDY